MIHLGFTPLAEAVVLVLSGTDGRLTAELALAQAEQAQADLVRAIAEARGWRKAD